MRETNANDVKRRMRYYSPISIFCSFDIETERERERKKERKQLINKSFKK